jgi:hypothetical protein
MKLARLPALPRSRLLVAWHSNPPGKSRRWHSEAAKIDDRHRQTLRLAVLLSSVMYCSILGFASG